MNEFSTLNKSEGCGRMLLDNAPVHVVILSKKCFSLFHAYARKNNMWILDHEHMYLKRYSYCVAIQRWQASGPMWGPMELQL